MTAETKLDDLTLILRRNQEVQIGCGSHWHYENHSYFSSCPSCPEGSPSANRWDIKKPHLEEMTLGVVRFSPETTRFLENLANSRQMSLTELLSEVISKSVDSLTTDK